MEFEIDVSGKDILSKGYVICIANKNNIIKGFKFDEKLVNDLCSKFGQGFYRYKKSKKGKSMFKIRLYCVVIYFLFKSINYKELSLNVCRDFVGREDDIRKTLKFFLEKKLYCDLEDRIYFAKLPLNSNAHKYAFLMRHDKKNRMDTYIKISLDEIERWLK